MQIKFKQKITAKQDYFITPENNKETDPQYIVHKIEDENTSKRKKNSRPLITKEEKKIKCQ